VSVLPYPEHLPFESYAAGAYDQGRWASANFAEPPEKSAQVKALVQANGNQSQAARILGINRVTVWNRMKKYEIALKKVLKA